MLFRAAASLASALKISRLALSSASALKISAPTSVALRHASRNLHTGLPGLAAAPPPLPEKEGKFRHGVLPEEFFQFLFPKTGVTGPYMFGAGLVTYLLSKEILVISSQTIAAASIAAALIYGIRKYGPQLDAYAENLKEEELAKAQEVTEGVINAQAIADEKKREHIARLQERNYQQRLGEGRPGLSRQLAPYEVLHEGGPHEEAGREERRAEFHSTAGEEKKPKAPQ